MTPSSNVTVDMILEFLEEYETNRSHIAIHNTVYKLDQQPISNSI